MISILLTAICTTGPVPAPSAQHQLPREMVPKITVDNLEYASLFKEDEQREKAGLAPAFAVPTKISITPATDGIWERVGIYTQRWTLRVSCDNALSMNLGFGRYNMPSSGSMTVTDANDDFRIRAFTADDNKTHGQLWTPVVPGNEAIIEIVVDNDQKGHVVKGIELTSINSGYRWVQDASGRGSSESCNIDVMCPEGDAWWNEIPSVGVYTLNGYLTCTGVMMNNTSQDQTPYFLTANHCGVTSGSDSSIVVYWNHQNSYCRTPGSNDSGGNGDGNFSQFTSGSTMRASRSYTDFTLTELSSNPNPAYGITYAGWSRASSASLGAGIHHPEAAEKRISFPDTVQASGEYWDVNWGEGRTAPGSSGSPLFDGNHRVVGQLCCGSSYCPNDLNDYYGRSLYQSWDGGSSSSLSSWLDPTGSGAQAIDSLVPGGGGDPSGACCVGQSCTYGTEADCSAIGGSYQGDYVSCTSYPCGGAPEGACCVGEDCSIMTQADCGSAGGSYKGDNTTCGADTCDNGGCEIGWTPDCQGTCFPDYVYEAWIGDGYCDDGAYIPADYGCDECPAGVAMWLNCDTFQCDGGDCTDCDGGGDPTGACCFGTDCFVTTEAECTGNGGEYVGNDTTCGSSTCGSPSTCDADINGDGNVDVSDILAMVSAWGTNDPAADVNGDGTVGVADLLLVIDGWGPCEGGGDPTGACCAANDCAVMTAAECAGIGGSYQGDNTSCAGDPCGGGGGCDAGWTEDCQGTCFPDYVYEAWVGDGYCDDGAYIPADYGCDECPAGVAIFLNCEAFNNDGGDCDGGGDPTGACCVGSSCTVETEANCSAAGGTYNGDGSSCSGDPCGGGGCEAGYSPDCMGTCFEDAVYTDWVGDGYCDDGAYIPADYGYGGPAGVAIWLNCAEFDCDGGDCTCDGGGTGACCISSQCQEMSSDQCSAMGGSYQGDGSSCASDPCGGGGGCPAGEIEDCNGNCCPADWVADGYCDDGTYEWNGIPIYLNCDEFQCDGGDCTGCDGGGCPAGEIEDCNGNCCPETWVGDGYCDDGTYSWNGIPIFLNCEEFGNDGGDCD
jgi:V8-like Glu-specific endopeptidase